MPLGHAGIAARAAALLEEAVQIPAHAGKVAPAHDLAAHLFDGVEDVAGIPVVGLAAAVQLLVVVTDPDREGIGDAAQPLQRGFVHAALRRRQPGAVLGDPGRALDVGHGQVLAIGHRLEGGRRHPLGQFA